MTREEAIAVLKGYIENPLVNDTKAFEMAIQALSQEPCDDAVSRKDAEQMFRNIRSHLKPQDYKSAEEFNTRDLMLLNAEQMIHALPSVTPKSIVCDDAISREAALEKMADYVASGYADSAEDFEEYSRIICQLPSVTQKSGKWNEYYTSQKGNNVFNCKECGHTFVVMQGKDNMNFCPNCGAKMESEDKE